MSKNLTRKGLAFGAMVALGSTLFAGVPAQANSSGPLTLTPNGVGGEGATYTSLIGAGLTLSSALDADKQSTATNVLVRMNEDGVTESEYVQAFAQVDLDDPADGNEDEVLAYYNSVSRVADAANYAAIPASWSFDSAATISADIVNFVEPAVDPLSEATYLIENPGGATIKLTLSAPDATFTALPTGYYLFDADGDAGGETTAGDITLSKGALGTADFNCGYDVTGTATARACADEDDYGYMDDELPFVDVVSNGFITNATKIAIKAEANKSSAVDGDRKVANLKVDAFDANATSSIKVKVTSFADTEINGSTEIAKINNGEWRSATQEVSLLPAASVPVTTRMSGTTDRLLSNVVATVALGSGVNPYAVAGTIGVVYYQDGIPITLDSHADSDAVSGAVEYHATALGDIDTDTGVFTVSVNATGSDFLEDGATAGSGVVDLKPGVYTARAIFIPTTPDIYVGARSAALDLRDGTNATVKGAKVTFTESNDVAVDANNDAAVRAGTKSLPVVGQILRITGDGATSALTDDIYGDLKAAGVRVRATVTGVTVDAASEITVTGSTDKIEAKDDAIVVFGFTNSDGQFPITINSNNGTRTDSVKVKFEALGADGLYTMGVSGSTGIGAEEVIIWERATLETDLEVSPSEFLTGDTINVTFTAVDQFGVGMDQNATGRISIRVDAYVDGAVKTATYSETKATTSGAASFSFANFATAGSNQEIRVQTLNASAVAATAYYTVYNNVASSGISVADEFTTSVQYVDFVTGKTTDPAVAKAAADVIDLFETALASDDTNYANIVGTVLDANNAGQPGSPVTIAAPGVLFHDLETKTLALDTITVFSNGQGFFDVQAMTQKLNTSGATVTITSGGKTVTTKLKSYLPTIGIPSVSDNETGFDASLLKLSWTLPEVIVKDTTYPVVVTLTDVWGNPIRTLYDEDNEDNAAFLIEGEGSLQVNGTDEIRKNTNSNGQFTFFVRSVSDIAGPGTVRVTLADDFALSSPIHDDNIYIYNTSDEFEDVADTSWDESLWSNTLEESLDVLNAAPAPTGKVNVGSFNGKLVVYAAGLDGAKISWKVAGKWGVANAVGNNLNRFDRPVGASGVNVIVEIYVNGVKQLTKTVLTR
jgi:hypothetical protein